MIFHKVTTVSLSIVLEAIVIYVQTALYQSKKLNPWAHSNNRAIWEMTMRGRSGCEFWCKVVCGNINREEADERCMNGRSS